MPGRARRTGGGCRCHAARPSARARPPPRRPARRGARRHPARAREGGAAAGAIARTRDHIDYAPGEPAFALLDFDRKGMPDAVAGALAARGGFWPAFVAAVPALARAARVRRASTSAGLLDLRTGAPVGAAAGGEHVYVLVRDGADVERFLRDLHERCWLHGFGWFAGRRRGPAARAQRGGPDGRARPSAWSSRARRCWSLRSARTWPPARRSGPTARRSTPAPPARRSRAWSGRRWPS